MREKTIKQKAEPPLTEGNDVVDIELTARLFSNRTEERRSRARTGQNTARGNSWEKREETAIGRGQNTPAKLFVQMTPPQRDENTNPRKERQRHGCIDGSIRKEKRGRQRTPRDICMLPWRCPCTCKKKSGIWLIVSCLLGHKDKSQP